MRTTIYSAFAVVHCVSAVRSGAASGGALPPRSPPLLPLPTSLGFGESATQTLVGANATRGNTTFGPNGSNGSFAVAGPSQPDGVVSISYRPSSASSLSAEREERYVIHTVDLQPPLGPNTYIGGVTISYTLSGANSTAVSFGLRRDAPDGCCAGSPRQSLQDYCDGVYTAKYTQTEQGGEQTATVDRTTIAYVARDNATRGAAFEHTIMSPVRHNNHHAHRAVVGSSMRVAAMNGANCCLHCVVCWCCKCE